MVEVKTLYPTGTITYNSVGVSPVTGHVYISRLKGYSRIYHQCHHRA